MATAEDCFRAGRYCHLRASSRMQSNQFCKWLPVAYGHRAAIDLVIDQLRGIVAECMKHGGMDIGGRYRAKPWVAGSAVTFTDDLTGTDTAATEND